MRNKNFALALVFISTFTSTARAIYCGGAERDKKVKIAWSGTSLANYKMEIEGTKIRFNTDDPNPSEIYYSKAKNKWCAKSPKIGGGQEQCFSEDLNLTQYGRSIGQLKINGNELRIYPASSPDKFISIVDDSNDQGRVSISATGPRRCDNAKSDLCGATTFDYHHNTWSRSAELPSGKSLEELAPRSEQVVDFAVPGVWSLDCGNGLVNRRRSEGSGNIQLRTSDSSRQVDEGT